jgi:hypothetical protein
MAIWFSAETVDTCKHSVKKQPTRGENESTAELHFHFAKETGDIHWGIKKQGEIPTTDKISQTLQTTENVRFQGTAVSERP